MGPPDSPGTALALVRRISAVAAPAVSPNHLSQANIRMNIYETDKLVSEYLLFHYANAAEIQGELPLPPEHLDFAKRSVWDLLPADFATPESPIASALDLGCAVGRSSFELTQISHKVLGIDFSHAFIQAANRLKNGEIIPYDRLEEAHVRTKLTAARPTGSNHERVEFQQGDALDLPSELGSFDLVHAANLLCRLPAPLRFLQRLPSLCRPGGLLLLTTPCTWLAEFTPPENWPTGSTLDWLKSELAPHFTLRTSKNLPFIIRETARKFQWTAAMGTVWERK